MYSTTLHLDNECEDLYPYYVKNALNGFVFSLQLTQNIANFRSTYIIVNSPVIKLKFNNIICVCTIFLRYFNFMQVKCRYVNETIYVIQTRIILLTLNFITQVTSL